jgi:hypothetical protein
MRQHRLDSNLGRVGSSPERAAVRSNEARPLARRVRSSEFSAKLLADIQSGARDYRAKHGNPFDWFGLERVSSQKTPPVETCPYCVKGITDDDLECTFCFGAGKLT